MKRKIILICFLLLILAIFPAGIKKENHAIPLIPSDDPRAESGFVYIQGSHFYLKGELYPLKGVNYYPSKNSWRRMWENWDAAEINTELALLENIGVNTARIFLDYKLFERNRSFGDNSIMLKRLDELLGILEIHGMKALITPFVWGSGNIETDRMHIRHIVSKFKDDKRIFGWDVGNELDHEWIENPSLKASIQERAVAIFEEIKATDKNHLVTVGDYGWYLGDRSDPYGKKLSINLSDMTIPIAKQDFICFHWYSHYYALDAALGKLKEKIAKPVPIVIEEIGLPSGGIQENGVPWYLDQEQVAFYYLGWLDVASRRGAYLMPWCGFDYSPDASPYGRESVQNYFGLYTAHYELKAAGSVYRDFSIEGRYIMRMLLGLPELKNINLKEIRHGGK